MANMSTPADLKNYLATAILDSLQKHNFAVPRAYIDDAIQQVYGMLEQQDTIPHTIEHQFLDELEILARYIRQTKEEIASIQPKEISTNHIPVARDELDAVIGATEDATNKIMDVCDAISALAESSPAEIKEQLIGYTTRIFEACNFQDITGQRITKVVTAIKHIDSKVVALLNALGHELHSSAHAPNPVEQKDSFLNGPQLPGQGMDQEKIDQLLAQ